MYSVRLLRLPSIACPSARRKHVHLRYFTPIDADNTRMFTFTMRRVKQEPAGALVLEDLLQRLVRVFREAANDQ